MSIGAETATLGEQASFHPGAVKTKSSLGLGHWQALCYGCRRTNSVGQGSQRPRFWGLDDFSCICSQEKEFSPADDDTRPSERKKRQMSRLRVRTVAFLRAG